MKEKTLSFYNLFSILRLSLNDDGENISVVKVCQYISKRKEYETDILSIVLELLVIHYCTTVTLESRKLNKCIKVKYEFENGTLIHLWCSGDIEINPGPILKEFIVFPKSYKERKWIQEMVSIALKTLKGIPEKSKPKQLWKEKPDNWPTDMPFYDPRNKSAAEPDISTTDEQLLRCILKCCESKNIFLSSCYQQEINAWINRDRTVLFELHICRQEISEIDKAINILYTYRHTTEFDKMLSERKIKIDFGVVIEQTYKPNKCKSDIIRDIAVTLCKLCHGVHPFKKRDGIWKSTPPDWDKSKTFYNPHNAGKRREKHTDQNLLSNLLQYCESNNIPIPTEYELIVCAWKQNNEENMRKVYDIQTNILLIEHSLKCLQFEGLLTNTETQDRLKNIGLTLSLGWNSSNTTAETSDREKPVTSGDSSRKQGTLPQSPYNVSDERNTVEEQGFHSTIIYDSNASENSFSSESEYVSSDVNKQTQCWFRSEKNTFISNRQIQSSDLQYIPRSSDGISMPSLQDSHPRTKRNLNKDNETCNDQDIHAIVSLADELFQDYYDPRKSTNEIQNNDDESLAIIIKLQQDEAVPVKAADKDDEPMNLHHELDVFNTLSPRVDQYIFPMMCSEASDPFLSVYDDFDKYAESLHTACDQIPITDMELEFNLLEDLEDEQYMQIYNTSNRLPETDLLDLQPDE